MTSPKGIFFDRKIEHRKIMNILIIGAAFSISTSSFTSSHRLQNFTRKFYGTINFNNCLVKAAKTLNFQKN